MNFNHPFYLNNKIRYAMNMVYGNDQTGVLTKERAIKLLKEVPEIKGYCNIPSKDAIILFSSDKIMYFKDDTCTDILDLPCPINDNIVVKCRIDECDNIELYWVENNPITDCNAISATDKFLQLGCDFKPTETISSCDDLLVTPCNECPTIDLNVTTGGAVLTGVYFVAVRLKDTNNFCRIEGPIDVSKKCLGVEKVSGKAITIFVSESEYELAIISKINGAVSAQLFTDLSQSTFTYSGQTGTGISINEILVNSVDYRSNVIQTFNNKLLKASLHLDDTLAVQSYANNVTASWQTIRVNPDFYDVPRNAMLFKSAMRDEVYSIGIQYERCDGTFTTWGHIPGTSSDNYDSSILEEIPETDARNCLCGDTQYHNLFNTASITGSPNIASSAYSPVCTPSAVTLSEGAQGTIAGQQFGAFTSSINVWEEGLLAYHESCTPYPADTYECDIYDCNGNIVAAEGTRVYPEGNIRHHKMPDNNLIQFFESDKNQLTAVPSRDIHTDIVQDNSSEPYDGTFIYPVLLTFDNIVLPPCTIGYRIGIVERTDTNKSVIAKGYTHGTFLGVGDDGAQYLTPKNAINSDNYLDQWITSQVNESTTSNSDVPAYTFHSPNTTFQQPSLNASYVKFTMGIGAFGVFYGANDGANNTGTRMAYNYTNILNTVVSCRSIVDITYAPTNSIINSSSFSHSLNNQFRESSVYFELEGANIQLPCQTTGPYSGLNLLLVAPILPNISNNGTSDESFSFAAHGSTGSDDQTYVSGCTHYITLKNNRCDAYNLNDSYTPIFSSSDVNAATLIGLDSFITPFEYKRTAHYFNFGSYAGSTDFYAGNIVPADSSSRTLHTMHFSIVESDVNTFRQECTDSYYCSNDILDITFNDDLSQDATQLNFLYNNDVGEIRNIQDNCSGYPQDYSTLGIATGFVESNYCCNSYFPNRIAYSQSVSLDNREENWRIFLESNYVDIPKDCGPIIRLVDMGNKLYVHCTEGIWQLFTNNSLQIDNNNIYVGTGDFFSQAPIKLFSSDTGYGGLQHYDDAVQSPSGYYWVDRKAGKIHRLTETIEEVALGMDQFFKEYNLSDATSFAWGIDNKLNRLLLTKHGGDKEFTISIVPAEEPFISFHSYLPQRYISTRQEMYSMHPNMYLHNRYECEFMTPFVLEYVISVQTLTEKPVTEPFNNILESVEFFIETRRCKDNKLCQCTTEFFDTIEIYNHCQSTGDITLIKLDPHKTDCATTEDELIISLQGHSWVVRAKNDYNVEDTTIRTYPCDESKAVIDRFNQDVKELNYPYYIVRLSSSDKDLEIKVLDRNNFVTLKNK